MTQANPGAGTNVLSPTWDPEAYPKLAHLMGRLPEAVVLRRFAPMNAMVLLSLQAKLVMLDKDLWRTCYESQTDPSGTELWNQFEKIHSEHGPGNLRAQKLKIIQDTIKEYYEMIVLFNQISELESPRRDQVRFLQNWLQGEQEGKNFLRGSERFTWSNKYEFDMVVPVKTTSWVHPNIFELAHWIKKSILQLKLRLQSKEWRTPPPKVDYFDVEIGKLGRVQDWESKRGSIVTKLFWRLVVLLIASMLPILAVLILYYIKLTIIRIGVALAMTAVVAFFLRTLTSASVKEIFGATAAFAAVVVVYIGSANGQ